MYRLCLSYFYLVHYCFCNLVSLENCACILIPTVQNDQCIGRKLQKKCKWNPFTPIKTDVELFFQKIQYMLFQASEWQLTVCSSCSWQAAKLPMSIIIVGVGQAEFDGENSNWSSSGNKCVKNSGNFVVCYHQGWYVLFRFTLACPQP